VLYDEPTAEALAHALQRAESMTFDSQRIRSSAERFSRDRHVAAMQSVIDDTVTAPMETRW
jgi:hypothetical protein